MVRWMWIALALGGCTPSPGLVVDDVPAGPSVSLSAEVEGSSATLTVLGRELGAAFGLSLHVLVDRELVRLDDFEAFPVLGDDAVHLARADGVDVALGGSMKSRAAGEVTLADGPLGELRLSARAGGSSRVEIVDALVRRLDGTFAPLAAAGGTLTLETP